MGERLGLRHAALGAALAYFVLIGGTDTGLVWLPFRAINAALAGILIGIWLWRLPRHADLTDKLALVALLVFLIACLTSAFPRMSVDAGVAAIAYAAVFGVARGELASPRARQAMVATLVVSGLVVAAVIAIAWGNFWLAWWNLTGSIPPLDLNLPAGPYRHYYVVAMQLALLMPAVVAVVPRRWIGPPALAGLVISLALIVMAGSRTVWVAVAVAAAVAAGLALRWSPRRAAVAVIGLVLAGSALVASGLLGPFVARLTTGSTIAARVQIWEASLTLWAERPLLGWGPGAFPPALTLTDYFSRVEAVGRHAHNVPIQLLAEAGLAGMLVLALILAALAVGIRNAPGGAARPALVGMGLFGLMSLTDNPSDLPHLAVTAICWAAMAAPRRQAEPALARIWPRVGVTVFGAITALAMATTLIAGYTFDIARDRARDADAAGVIRALDVAVALDPGNAQFVRERGLWRAAAGDPGGGLTDLVHAVDLNQADVTAYRSLAALSLNVDAGVAVGFAQAAAEMRELHTENAVMLAYVAGESGRAGLAADALTQAVRVAPWIIGSSSWRDWFADPLFDQDVVQRVFAAFQDPAQIDPRFTLPALWSSVLAGQPYAGPDSASIRALDAVLRCQPGADDAIERAHVGDAGAAAAIIQARLRDDEESAEDVIALAQLRGVDVARLATERAAPMSPFVDPVEDARIYHRHGLPPPDMGPLLPTSDEGLSAWLRTPRETARQTALGLALATCEP